MSSNTSTTAAFKQNDALTQKTFKAPRIRGTFDNAMLLGFGTRIFKDEIPNGVSPLDEVDYVSANRNSAPAPVYK